MEHQPAIKTEENSHLQTVIIALSFTFLLPIVIDVFS